MKKQRGEPKQPARPKEETSLNLREIKQLLDLVEEKGFTELELEQGGTRLRVRRDVAHPVLPSQGPVIAYEPVPVQPQLPAAQPVAAPPAAPIPLAPPPPPTAVEEDLYIAKSPIVGTFYESSSPGSPAFVAIGQAVQRGQVLCIVEAMKLMNEIESEVAGEVVKCFVKNGQPVEYGQPLFAIRQA
jgi:acetyl-CoA carboxylase biotin carboxyl carrier protein